ncbi:hypothetical protein [Aeromicrobium ginsengisoli]|uniref:hypothetical protein n=1 Tax=Aeromicrobium ginsengisoli TaxID=363867 RepID=UPI00165ED802|nr:hypothetical protein [Aeromicrobium ginsengisoli]
MGIVKFAMPQSRSRLVSLRRRLPGLSPGDIRGVCSHPLSVLGLSFVVHGVHLLLLDLGQK